MRAQLLRKQATAARKISKATVENERQAPRTSAFGALLRQYRVAAGLSQEALAERARMSADGISALERGYRRTPQRETLTLLAGALALNDEERAAFEVAAARSELLRRPGEVCVTVGPWSGAPTAVLPLALTSFVARETELEELAALVREHRLVTVTGPGGVGKTQMAVRFASRLNEAADRVICFVGLASIRDPALVETTIASALGAQEVPNHPLLETLQAYVKNRTMLLILDNCEHVIAGVRAVAEAFLLNCPRARILATSRESFRAAGELVYRLPPLAIPSTEAVPRIRLRDVREYGAIWLFVDRARAVDHRFTLSDENAPIVAEICRRLDGIPLAIELAAARMNVLSVQALAQKLDNRFGVLTGGTSKKLPRQQTMRAAIDWSYDLLSAQEQHFLANLSVFAGSCTFKAAAVVGKGENASENDVLDLLSSLVDKSLLISDLEAPEPRYRLLESFREYAYEKLEQRGDRGVVVHRHAVACLELGKQLERAYDSGPDESWRALVRDEIDNWRAALHWTLTERGDVLLGQRLVGQLNVVWQYLARVEGRRWIAVALELVDERTPRGVLARLAYTAATVAMLLREYNRQLTSSRSAIARYQDVGDSLGAARAQDIASFALFALGRVEEAQALAKEVLAFARGAGNRRLAAGAMRTLSAASAFKGDVVQARRYIAEALSIYDALGATYDAATTLNDLAYVESRAGNTELALHHSSDALASCGDLYDLSATMDLRNDVVRHLIWLLRYDEAEDRAREMLAIARERHEDGYAVLALQHLGAIIALRPDAAERRPEARSQATRMLGFSEARIAAIGSPRWPDDQLVYDRAVAALRDAMGAAAVTNLLADGAAMTEEQAVEEALR
jgi:predicted ATPase/transcriptional regulator with XRE-family HTH domain